MPTSGAWGRRGRRRDRWRDTCGRGTARSTGPRPYPRKRGPPPAGEFAGDAGRPQIPQKPPSLEALFLEPRSGVRFGEAAIVERLGILQLRDYFIDIGGAGGPAREPRA